jgi:hypothetical protein
MFGESKKPTSWKKGKAFQPTERRKHDHASHIRVRLSVSRNVFSLTITREWHWLRYQPESNRRGSGEYA